MEAHARLALRTESGLHLGRLYPLNQELFMFGRKPDAEILIEDAKASREHAVIEKTPLGDFILKDLASTNGTFVNGQRIMHNHQLKCGDVIRIGHQSFRVDEFDRVHKLSMAEWNTPTTLQNRSEVFPEETVIAEKPNKSKQLQWSILVACTILLFGIALFVNLQL